jgi:ATPase subunit of ABC transporter with duplicated ATPase domains
MTFVSRSHDAFQRIEEAQAELAEIAEREADIRSKLERAQAEAELALLLADVASVMRDVDMRNFSEGKRVRFQGVRKRVFQALGVSP